MTDKIKEILNTQFNFMHEYHCDRTAGILEMLQQNLGDEVLGVAGKSQIDRYGLYRWHLERLISLVDLLEERYGEKALNLIKEFERRKSIEQGQFDAKKLGTNSLQDIIPYFTGGNRERIVQESENEVLIKTVGCLSGRIGAELGKTPLLYSLHCDLDNYYVQGFNDELDCEIIKTLMEGHQCCLHRIYKK